jgi:hypothetical protein
MLQFIVITHNNNDGDNVGDDNYDNKVGDHMFVCVKVV